MQTLNTKFEKILREIIETQVQEASETISHGQMIPEIYKFECGKLAGMRQVLGYLDEVNDKLAER